jgi:CBS domain-containing protein
MLKAKDIMTTDVLAVARNADIYRAIRMMVENNVTGLPVIGSDRTLVGVVTEKDVLKLLYEVEDRPGKVEDFMTEAVVAFDEEADIETVAEGLAANHFRRVPILKEGRLVGIISRKDVIKHIKEQWLTEKAPA